MDSIILFSSGRESLINLHEELKYGNDVTLWLFNYGQKSFVKEKAAADYYAALCGAEVEVDELHLVVGPAISQAANKNNHVNARNLIFLSHLYNYLPVRNYEYRILFGATKNDKEYNDGSTQFFKDIKKIFEKLYPLVELDSHTKDLYNEDTFDHLLKLEVDVSRIWMCDNKLKKMCGKCFKCVQNIKMWKRNKSKAYEKYKNILWR